jgi:predicted nucleic acid-binding protein
VQGPSIATACMSAESSRFTLDTNLLVYSVDSAARARHQVALEIVDGAVESECWLTLQALCEFYVAVTRKGIVPPAEAAAQATGWLDLFPTVAASAAATRAALADAAAGRASYWDAPLMATAAQAGCMIVLTEDMSDGSTLGGLRIHNPFVASGGLTGVARRLLGLPAPD